MSWPLACFAIVGSVLVVGWFAYERSRPSARTATLVATLAALAALGRDAFAAFAEVKPITAMTFVVGYCLGPLPGFLVGAIGMLASNLLLGEGPWTPWQMAAWGVVGLLGAAAGAISRRRLSRLPLALCCAAAALVAKEIMNLYVWTVGAIHTPAAMLAHAVEGLPYDVVDVVSTLLFGLAFGPELARLLARMRARTEVEWRPAGTLVPVALALLTMLWLAGGAPAARAGEAPGAAATSKAIARAIAYLRSAQKPDGGFGPEAGATSAELYTGWSAIGLAAAGQPPALVVKDGRSLVDGLSAGAATLKGVGDIERTILALHACGVPAARLAGRDLKGELGGYRKPDGSISDEANHTAFAILAMRALGESASDPSVQASRRWLGSQQNPDGGFSFGTRGDPSEIDNTAAVIEGLVAAGAPRSSATVSRAVAFLRRSQRPDGGFPLQPGEEPNAPSTAWAVLGLRAAAQRLSSNGRSPIAYLESLAAPNGSIRYAAGNEQTPVWVTAEALAALSGRSLPIAAPRVPLPLGGSRAQLIRAVHGAEDLASSSERVLAGLLAS